MSFRALVCHSKSRRFGLRPCSKIRHHRNCNNRYTGRACKRYTWSSHEIGNLLGSRKRKNQFHILDRLHLKRCRLLLLRLKQRCHCSHSRKMLRWREKFFSSACRTFLVSLRFRIWAVIDFLVDFSETAIVVDDSVVAFVKFCGVIRNAVIETNLCKFAVYSVGNATAIVIGIFDDGLYQFLLCRCIRFRK